MQWEGNGSGGGGEGGGEGEEYSGGKKWRRVKEKGEVEMSECEVLRRGVKEESKGGWREAHAGRRGREERCRER